MILLFILQIFCFDEKNPAVVSLKSNEDLQFSEAENGRFRLKIISEHSHKLGDKNVVTFEPSDDLFLVKFSNGKYLFKTDGEDVELAEKTNSPLNNYDPLQGFKWDIKATQEGYKFETDGTCIEKFKSTGIPDEFEVKALRCSDTPNQLFNIKDVNAKKNNEDRQLNNTSEADLNENNADGDTNSKEPVLNGNVSERERKKSQVYLQIDQKEGPTINPTIHGWNNKRDPYMYGNEPYRGRSVRTNKK